VERGVLLLQSLAGPQPCRRPSHLRHPPAELIGGKLDDLDVAEGGADQCAVAIASVGAGLPVAVQEAEGLGHGIAPRGGAMLAVGAVRALDHCLPCRLLCLPKVERRNAVSIRVVVGGADPGDLIGLLADVVAGDPGAGLTITEPAIAEMQPALDGPVIGLP